MRDKILYEIQKNFPLSPRPFESIAKSLDCSEEEVLDIVKSEKDKGTIRQISAIFDTKRLGYRSSLVAFKVDENDIDNAVEVINSHPGVSHNYERDHEFNIWFTIAVPPDSKLGLEKSISLLSELSNAKEYIALPTIKLFKIAVKMDTTGKAPKKEKIKRRVHKDIEINDLHKNIIKYAQNDIEITKEPFKDMIEKIGVSYEKFFDILDELKNAGVMRRYAAILNHRKAGFNANAMVVWDIDEEIAQEMGEKIASFSAVSHCYLRPKYPNWPYNLFSMVHGKTKDETDAIVKEMEKEVVFHSNRYLYSSREFKKVRVKYFTDDVYKWEDKFVTDLEA
ncbi:MAG: Lrp/AsnC family transcriptional regulator [Epsilonproteobacteria bacterium]|nr:Lrp/AsnC family transcriptional regulator [Campylobacterota bacterium]